MRRFLVNEAFWFRKAHNLTFLRGVTQSEKYTFVYFVLVYTIDIMFNLLSCIFG